MTKTKDKEETAEKQNTSVNGTKTVRKCESGLKRGLDGSDCPRIDFSPQHNGPFHPQEPYINDLTPIAPIQSMDQIAWINDYQPIKPIEDVDYRSTILNPKNEYGTKTVRYMSAVQNRKKDHGKVFSNVRNSKSDYKTKLHRSKTLRTITKKNQVLENTRPFIRKRRFNNGGVSRLVAMKDTMSNFAGRRIFPLKLNNILTNFIKNRLKARMKLLFLARQSKESAKHA